jgi:predicted aminopeptidase
MGCEMGYLLRQGVHQFQLLNRSRPVHEVLADPAVPLQVKEKIRLVQSVRERGERELGLHPTDAYSSYVDLQGRPLAYLVSAARKDKLEPYLWRFPIVGAFPYKGFFKKEEAEAFIRRLQEKGFDTYLSIAAAFSALGWFSDPLYSSLLEQEEVEIVYTILHEMVHATVFFPDRVDFNEQLATFVGWQGTLRFVEEEWGRQSLQWKRTLDIIHDERLVGESLQWAHDRLAEFYGRDLPLEEKLRGRRLLFREIRTHFEGLLPRLRTRRFLFLRSFPWNNASLLALWRYRYDVGALESLYACLDQDLPALIRTVAGWRRAGTDPLQALFAICPARQGGAWHP